MKKKKNSRPPQVMDASPVQGKLHTVSWCASRSISLESPHMHSRPNCTPNMSAPTFLHMVSHTCVTVTVTVTASSSCIMYHHCVLVTNHEIYMHQV